MECRCPLCQPCCYSFGGLFCWVTHFFGGSLTHLVQLLLEVSTTVVLAASLIPLMSLTHWVFVSESSMVYSLIQTALICWLSWTELRHSLIDFLGGTFIWTAVQNISGGVEISQYRYLSSSKSAGRPATQMPTAQQREWTRPFWQCRLCYHVSRANSKTDERRYHICDWATT